MKLFLLFALKISVVVHFDYGEYKTTLSSVDAEWVNNCLKDISDSSHPCEPCVSKKVHGYNKIEFNYIEGNAPNSLDSKFVFSNNNILLADGTNYTIKDKDFEYNLIKKIFDEYDSKNIDYPLYHTKFYLKWLFPNLSKTFSRIRCNKSDVITSQQPKFPKDDVWTPEFLNEYNCLNWALNIFKPSLIKNSIDSVKKMYSCATLIDVLQKNELIYIGMFYEECPKDKREIIALATSYKDGYHFYRKDDGPYWSHKAGHNGTVPSQRDYYYRLIKDPKEANNGDYFYFCGYFVKSKEFANKINEKNIDTLKNTVDNSFDYINN